MKHQWVYDLQQIDNDNIKTSFSKDVLVILRCNQLSKLSPLTLATIVHPSNTVFHNHVTNVIIIQRCILHQVYCVSGLQSSLHFSLGPKSYEKFTSLCTMKHVTFTVYSNEQQTFISDTLSILNDFPQKTNSVMIELQQKLINAALEIIPDLLQSVCFKLKPNSNKRSNAPSTSLGITDQKVHLHQRCTITGKVELQLISTWKKDLHLSEIGKKAVSDLLCFIATKILPLLKCKKKFEPYHEIERHYLDMFARQLNVTNKETIQNFIFPAVSFLINKNLSPHCDVKNPTNSELDYTLSSTVMIPTQKFQSHCRQILEEEFGNEIPFCIVLYRRQCLYL